MLYTFTPRIIHSHHGTGAGYDCIQSGGDRPIGTALNGSDLYVSALLGNKIVKIDLTQPFPVTPTTVLSNITTPTGLTVIGDYLYFNTEGNIPGMPGVSSARINLTSPTPVIERVLSDDIMDAQAYAQTGDTLYISTVNHGIFRVNLSQPFPQAGVVVKSGIETSGLALRGNELYYGFYGSDKVWKINRHEPNPTPVLVLSGLAGPDGLTFSGNFLYVSESSGSRIVKFDVTQPNPTVETVVDGLDGPTLTVFDGLSIYFGQQNNGQVSRLDINELSFSPPAPVCLTDVSAQRNGGSPLGGQYSGPNVTDNGDGATFTFNAQAAGPGTHSVTYTFGALSAEASITVGTTFLLATSSTPNSGATNDGTATALVSGGTAPYNYLWSNGGTNATITGLAAGTYTVTVIDVSGCVQTAIAVCELAGDVCATATNINYLFGTEIEVPVVSAPYTNTGATASGDPSVDITACFFQSDPLQSTVWFTFTGDGNRYRFRTVQGSSTNYIQDGDTQAAVFQGDCANPAYLGCVDDEDVNSGKYNIAFEIVTAPGEEYRMMWDGYGGFQGEFCLEVTLVELVSATEITPTEIGIAPNPTKGLVQWSNVNADEVQVFDYTGRMLQRLAQPGNSIDLSGQPAGLYFLQIREKDTVYTARVVKE
ncbi:MAG: T9SS type A sorting domain-containing protein [Saprospiraceae bacterium]|nr:T9SS type A sorting domain-containing protein [Candidatus Opimibacter iunctus]